MHPTHTLIPTCKNLNNLRHARRFKTWQGPRALPALASCKARRLYRLLAASRAVALVRGERLYQRVTLCSAGIRFRLMLDY